MFFICSGKKVNNFSHSDLCINLEMVDSYPKRLGNSGCWHQFFGLAKLKLFCIWFLVFSLKKLNGRRMEGGKES